MQVYREAYTSDHAINMEHAKVEGLSDKDLETILLLCMILSDTTHLTNFGTAQLWPIYIWLANYTKYAHGDPLNYALFHLRYLPKIPDLVKKFYQEKYGKPPTEDVL
ncbi:ubiquitin and ribosomal protein s27a [Moniliophthora roreri MCA 2997]|uniref:Ubiquitin and ribosomal protein s27a n=2 Tax=Moniliophthora roreri TaxID=221103 RepID=V2WIA8_MONRO|nr:ubiquitin and ribosomal protein s27a [Moniliophthora roreri MCA 2997]